jgi:5'-3' exonuclease
MLLKHFESLDHLYAGLDSVLKLKIRNAGFVVGQLRDHREAAFLARRLTAIACDAPLQSDLCDLKRRPPDMNALNALYDTFGFGRLLRHQAERIVEKLKPAASVIPSVIQ